MRRVAIHQPNFIPWLPFFYKMAMADVFILLNHVQFEKNGYQNRYKINGSWVTKSVKSGTCRICDKLYTDGQHLQTVNLDWIRSIKQTLGITTPIVSDYNMEVNPTNRLIDLVKDCGGDVYITSPDAKDKYLDEDKMKAAGIDIEYCNIPPHLKIHTFEAFSRWGIDGTANQLPGKLCTV